MCDTFIIVQVMRQKHTSEIFSSGSAPRLSYKSLSQSQMLFIKCQYQNLIKCLFCCNSNKRSKWL